MALRMPQALASSSVRVTAQSSSRQLGAADAVYIPQAESEFTVVVSRRKDRLVVTVSGMLDDTSVGELRRAFLQVFNAQERLVVVEVSAVPLIDSDGFGALINIQKRLTESGRSLALAGCQEAVRLALALTRLEVLFPSYADVDSVPV